MTFVGRLISLNRSAVLKNLKSALLNFAVIALCSVFHCDIILTLQEVYLLVSNLFGEHHAVQPVLVYFFVFALAFQYNILEIPVEI
jgi:hypothetical protein